MKRELLVNKRTIFGYIITYVLFLIVPLSMFLINTENFRTRNYVEVQGYYFILYAVLVVIILMMPLIFKGNDNKQFYLALPKSRIRIMLDKYGFVLLSGLIGAALAYGYFEYLMFIFLQSGMMEGGTGDGLDIMFTSVQWIIIFGFSFKVLMTTAYGVDLLNRFRILFKIMLPVLGTILFIVFSVEFYSQIDSSFEETLHFPNTVTYLIVIVLGSVGLDFLSFTKGEV